MTPLYEQAIWKLDGVTGTFVDEAKDDLEVAKQSEDAVAIERAQEKLHLMYRANSENAGGGLQRLSELRAYCEAHQGNVS